MLTVCVRAPTAMCPLFGILLVGHCVALEMSLGFFEFGRFVSMLEKS